jgi:hypothetical protein
MRAPRAGVEDVTPRPVLLAAKSKTINSGYSECDGFISAYKKVRRAWCALFTCLPVGRSGVPLLCAASMRGCVACVHGAEAS